MRIFIPSGCADLDKGRAILTDPGDIHHVCDVMRMGRGDKLTLCDPGGMEHNCIISAASSAGVEAEILSSAPSQNEPRIRVNVFTAVMKGDKMDDVVMKCVELGAAEITPFLCSRCVSRPSGQQADKKQARLQKIAKGAAQQSGRSRIPEINSILTFEAAVIRALTADIAVLLYENELNTGLGRVLSGVRPNTVSIMSGPEGGFTLDEADHAVSRGMKTATLGRRVLRCETAPICALSAVMYQSGEF